MHGEASNADGSVAVTVTPTGAVVDLRLTPEATQRPHTQLQRELLEAIRVATERAGEATPAPSAATRRLPPPRPSAAQRRRSRH
ncbi:YbaB/EbfC family nucleoid-associated protein [Amycolatopsis cihanbeyliensis]|uniref:YbaB/EbfC DNA-binding family protein n=1 Tax=Amycolatopsis cihanbeyliensis TaxID=1128664 RepID=A0A542DM46_AMYCI|nr:YbaB/EbfC family nucleoid-associated protein [Amycolatopsis cihanbeyliensis]TQJ04176.1 YbaB/EbfC DNA-binding family protein [Amycolatopsis cihanbeyliensis]